MVSKQRLDTCHPDLIKLISAVSQLTPIMVICGHRDKAGQDAAIAAKTSKTPFPKSKHNKYPSLAVDIAPIPLNWNDRKSFIALSETVFRVANSLGIHIRWGGDFNQDGSKTTNDAWDLPHYELTTKKS